MPLDYEVPSEGGNSRVVLLILIALIGINYIFQPINYVIKDEPVINVTVTPTPIIIYKNITVTVTPTPDGKTYFAGEYQSGIRKLGRLFSWNRDNASGYKDMSGHVKVYDYRMFDSIHVFNPTDYKYYETSPESGKKFLFIFVKTYLDDIIGDASPLWLPNENHFFVNDGYTLYSPVTFEKRLRIKELEDTQNDNRDYKIEYYGVFNTYSRDKQHASTAGETAEQLYYVQNGESNAIDGYIVYVIPNNVDANNITVIADMYAFGQPSWTLNL